MDIKRLLNQDIINFATVDRSLRNREMLIKDPVLHPSIDWFVDIQCIQDPVIMPYFLGDSEIISKLICVCKRNFIPIFPSDIIEIVYTHGKTERFQSQSFINNMLDGFADADNLMTSCNRDSILKLINIRSIQIVDCDSQEVIEFIRYVSEFDIVKGTGEIKTHVMSLIDNELVLSKGLNQMRSIESIPSEIETILMKDLPSCASIKKNIEEYIRTRDILCLVRLIYFLGKNN